VARLDATRLKTTGGEYRRPADKDQTCLSYAREMAGLRRRAAAELHAICAEFVGAVNRLLFAQRGDPRSRGFPGRGFFTRKALHLLQINSRGRILQIEFAGHARNWSPPRNSASHTPSTARCGPSTSNCSKGPDRGATGLYTIEKHKKMWRFFDARTYRSGPFDQDYLVALDGAVALEVYQTPLPLSRAL